MKRNEFLQNIAMGGIALASGSLLTSCSGKPRKPKDYGIVNVHDSQTQVPQSVNPLFDHWLRDVQIGRGPDGYYYLTGTIAQEGVHNQHAARHFNKGIQMWRSKDLKKWEDMGLVWSFEKDGTWQKDAGHMSNGDKQRTLWAASIHYLESQKNYFLVACIPNNPHGNGSFILRSKTGKPEGPYENIKGNKNGPIFSGIDGNLFEDDDGSVYFIGLAHKVARMKEDMSDFAEPLRKFDEKAYDPEPYIEGASLFKANGKYHLAQAIWSIKFPDGTFRYNNPDNKSGGKKYSYDCVIASSDNIYGPYSYRYTAITNGGHNNFIKNTNGEWAATMFGNPGPAMNSHIVCRPALVPMHQVKGGEFKVDTHQ
jgi:beta-xylosidase